jgi:hypothetical protein
MTSMNVKKGFDETSSLKPSSGEERSGLSYAGTDKKIYINLLGTEKSRSQFDWTKQSQKSLSHK